MSDTARGGVNAERETSGNLFGVAERGGVVLYCRIPGLVAGVVRVGLLRQPGRSYVDPVIITDGRVVRDACSEAVRQGVVDGMVVTRARRLCPHVLAVPMEQVPRDVLRDHSRILLDALADLSPVVEPGCSQETAYADLKATDGIRSIETAIPVCKNLNAFLRAALPDAREPMIAVGPSRLAARALAESGCLEPDRLGTCDTRWLWSEDFAVVSRLFRLGLTTFGAVASLPESALIYQFGSKVGPILWRRARGLDLTPVRSLYPAPRVEEVLDLSMEPVSDGEQLWAVLRSLAGRAANELNALGRCARRVTLSLSQEDKCDQCEDWVAPAPVQGEHDLLIAVRNLLRRFTITSPVTGVRLAADDLDLPSAVSGDLFQQQAQGGRHAVVAARRMLTTRYGTKILRLGSELPVERRDRRRTLVREARLP